MHWLVLLIAGVAEKIFSWFLKKGIKVGALFLTYVAMIVGLFTAFLSLVWLTLGAVKPLAPEGMAFILSLLPPSTSAMISAYFTVLLAKRVFDWHAKITKDFSQASMGF